MMLYDVTYPHSRDMDSDTASLPKSPPDGTRAKNTNWDGHVLIFDRGEWRDAKPGE